MNRHFRSQVRLSCDGKLTRNRAKSNFHPQPAIVILAPIWPSIRPETKNIGNSGKNNLALQLNWKTQTVHILAHWLVEMKSDSPNSPWANSKIPTFHFFPRGGRFDFINWFILPRITGNRLLGVENVVECCVLDESLKYLLLPWQHIPPAVMLFLAVQ